MDRCSRTQVDLCQNVVMPNIDKAAKAWQLDLAGRLGEAVQARRKALNMTALQLAQRTKELGYPITRVAISKIETNTRAGKFDVAELFVLAAALDIPPVLLLFPGNIRPVEGYGFGEVHELLPGVKVNDGDSGRWLSGLTPLPDQDANVGTRLVAATASVVGLGLRLMAYLANREEQPPGAEEAYQATRRRLEATNAEISELRAQLWGVNK